jgi:hypothetical protein
MNGLPCGFVRRRLESFHDGELSVAEHIQVAAHLQDCAACAWEAGALSALGSALRERLAAPPSDAIDFGSACDAIVARVQAERQQSLPARVGRLFEDMHLVWAGLSATGAMVTCAALLFAIWFLSPPERDDSLAGVLAALAAPGSDRNPVSVDQRMQLPLLRSSAAFPDLTGPAAEEDLVFTLAAVVTREGRIARSTVLSSNHPDRDVLKLMNALNEMRFQPASRSGAPVAVNLVWLVTHTTVRAKIHS